MGKASRRKRAIKADEVKHELENQGVKAELDSLKAGVIPEGIALGAEICDFCSSPDVKWGYRTKPGDFTEGDEGGGWAACDPCHDLIEKGDYEGVIKRSVEGFRRKHPMMASIPYKALAEIYKPLHDNFRKHKTGEVLTNTAYFRKYGRKTSSNLAAFMEESGLNEMVGASPTPGDQMARPTPPGDSILHTVEGPNGEMAYIPEGFTPDQLTDPRTIEYLMQRISRDRPVPRIPITMPVQPVLKRWVGARTYIEACAAVYGETPRGDDLFAPRSSMMMASLALEGILGAHPIVLEPGQMNAIDEGDWSFAEAIEYARMAHLPFEPLYLDFGGHEPVMVDLTYGQCQLHGAVFWRSSYFRTPSLAVCPIGGFDYLTGPFAEAMLELGIPHDAVIDYVGSRPGKEINIGDQAATFQRSDLHLYRTSRKQLQQWQYQPGGICWFGLDPIYHSSNGGEEMEHNDFVTLNNTVKRERDQVDVPLTFSTGKAISNVLGEDRLGEAAHAIALTGIYPDPQYSADPKSMEREVHPLWADLANGATEMVTRLCERALLGLYFLENAPVRIQEADLSRPERREMERDRKKGRDPGKIASIVVIQGRRSSAPRSEEPGSRNYTHRWERRGYFMHIHENNRHYQNRPDLVKPCHKCEYEYEENLKAKREGKEEPYPHTESPDCIKKWVEPTVCGPEDKELKVKVRVRRKDQPNEEAA